MRRLTTFLSLLCTATATHAVTPCDFKGLSVGDKATPQQIMTHFGITQYVKNADDPPPNQTKGAAASCRECLPEKSGKDLVSKCRRGGRVENGVWMRPQALQN